MANITLFDIRRGDVTLTAAVLARIQSGALTLYLLTENGEVKLDAAAANAIVAGTKTLRVLHSSHGHKTVNSTVLAALT
jgi:hypothetical protein